MASRLNPRVFLAAALIAALPGIAAAAERLDAPTVKEIVLGASGMFTDGDVPIALYPRAAFLLRYRIASLGFETGAVITGGASLVPLLASLGLTDFLYLKAGFCLATGDIAVGGYSGRPAASPFNCTGVEFHFLDIKLDRILLKLYVDYLSVSMVDADGDMFGYSAYGLGLSVSGLIGRAPGTARFALTNIASIPLF